jgi:hypothetical protein
LLNTHKVFFGRNYIVIYKIHSVIVFIAALLIIYVESALWQWIYISKSIVLHYHSTKLTHRKYLIAIRMFIHGLIIVCILGNYSIAPCVIISITSTNIQKENWHLIYIHNWVIYFTVCVDNSLKEKSICLNCHILYLKISKFKYKNIT